MPRPQFITCQLCGRGFGSASINIHIPQCYEKALKRWKVDPSGPRPVMPPLHGSAAATKKMGGGGATMSSSNAGFGEQPRGGGVSAARSLQGQNPQPFTEDAPANMNLHPCFKCGRNFNFDRITYHESVCKGDRKRRVFDSSKQRRATADGEDGFGGGFGGSTYGKGGKKRQLGVAATTSRYTPAPAPQTNWRQQHEEFINAIRSAKRADSESQNMWGTSSAAAPGGRAPVAPSRGPQRAPYTRSTNAGTGFGGAATSTRGMPQPAQRVPPLMTKQSESRRQNIASGGRAAQAKSSVPLGPPQGRSTRPVNRASQQQRSSFGGGSADRFGGRGYGMGGGGGGGGGGRVVNDNTSSLGMLQALGQA